MFRSLLTVVRCAGFAAVVFATARPLVAAQSPGTPSAARPAPSPGPVTTTPQSVAAGPGDPCGGPTRLLATIDRPTTGYSVCAVPQGSILFEDGYQLMSQFGGGSVAAAYPESLVRFGVADRLELDVVGPNFNRVRSGESIASGFGDLGIGTKYEFAPRGKVTYAVDLLFVPPDGDASFTTRGTTEQLNVEVSNPITSRVGISVTLAGIATYGSITPVAGAGGATGGGVALANQAPSARQYGLLVPSATVTYAIPSGLQLFLETVGQTKTAVDRGGQLLFDAGAQKLLGTNVLIDAEYGRALGPVAGGPFQYVGGGIGVRVGE